MRRSLWLRVLSWVTLATLAVVVPAPSHAQDGESRLERQMAAAAARQARESERARVARQHWALDRRRSAAHARMPDTMYASTPSAPAVELSCPVVTSDDVRRAVQGWGDEVSSSPFSSADGLAARDGGVLRARPLQGLQGVFGSSWSSGDNTPAAPHDGWSGAFATATGSRTTSHLVPLFPAASDAALQGFVRVINHSGDSGEVQIDAIDDTGVFYGPLTLSIDGDATVHFNSDDLEGGNSGKGLTGSTGAGEGDWRLALTSDLEIEVLSYIRTTDGFLTAMHDLAPAVEEGVHRIAIFNPGSNTAQVSRLRLINPGDTEARVTIEGVDDRGMSPGSALEVTVAAGATQTLTAAELESGGTGMTGALGDGAGKWQLTVKSESSIHALSLLSSPTGHLTNLSTAPPNVVDGFHEVALFPSASDISGRQGFVRVINQSESTAEITIRAHDETDWEYEPLMLSLGSGQVAHFNSDDLEQGNAGKGLTGSTGAGEGDWRLELSSDSDIEVLSYIRTTDGFLTAMHDVAPVSGTRHRVAIFNPGSNTAQVSRLRLVNAGEETAAVTIVGADDRGLSPGGDVLVTVPAGGTRTYTAQELEEGAEGLEGSLGDGAGKWRLRVTSDQPIRVLSLLSSPTGHLTNLSTATARGSGMETAAEVLRTLISGPIVQSKCVNCHVEEGVSGNTRLVFVTDAEADHMATNLKVFEDFLAEVEDGASYILNKIQGALGHGGGIQVASGTEEFSSMQRFLGLLAGEEVGPVTLTPANLFDGVKMASRHNILRRAAIIFAGRIPTEEEYESIRGASADGFRAAIRNLMQGPEFHEFLIRASNDRLLTDRDLEAQVIPRSGEFVAYTNKFYRLIEEAGGDPEDAPAAWYWRDRVQYGASRAPLELIAYVAENDLPYTQVVSADYIMANPWAADAYGASTVFDDPDDVHEFRPSEIVSYFANHESKQVRIAIEKFTIAHVTDPGDLKIDYPHAGVLNTTAFMLRYPSTATNRNRARSRWTQYHFLGLDIEKSASRTTDPVALVDTNNPTLHNPACTVCHRVLDPVAGAFQNYGDIGLYRDQPGGLDSLDRFYKVGFAVAEETLEVVAPRGDPHVVTMRAYLTGGNSRKARLSLRPRFDPLRPEGSEIWWHMGIDHVKLRDASGTVLQHLELQDLVEEMELCGPTDQRDDYYVPWFCSQDILLDVATAGDYEVEVVLWFDAENRDGDTADRRRLLDVSLGGHIEGDTWYRDMRHPGFDGAMAPDSNKSLRWLAAKVVADHRFAEATVKFWWPAIMGSEVAMTPEDEDDADFEGALLASNAQAAEVAKLARGFRGGFGMGTARPYNLKDLLVELALSRWFRATSVEGDNPVRAAALRGVGASRLLTPDELTRKTLALTGFRWGRERPREWHAPQDRGKSLLDNTELGYGLLYGGIDSDGVTERGRDLTSMMSGVAQSHAVETSCPIVMKELYLLADQDRRLFAGSSIDVTPNSEFGGTFEVEAASSAEREVVSVSGRLERGEVSVTLAFLNNEAGSDPVDRNLRLDRLDVKDARGNVVDSHELEEATGRGCEWNRAEDDHFAFYCNGSVEVLVMVPTEGTYDFQVVAWADQNPGELAKLEILIGSGVDDSNGAQVIKAKLVELYERLHGVQVAVDSPEISGAYELFIDVWNRQRQAVGTDFEQWRENIDCTWRGDEYFLDGIVEDAFVYREDWGDEGGARYDWDRDRIDVYLETIDWSDRNGVARTWVVVLAYLLMDYRYLYL